MAPSVATYATPAPATSPITEARYNPTVSEDVPAVAVEHNLEEHVAFGGDDQWHYNTVTRRFDLSRGSKRKLIVDADDGIRNHRGVLIDPEKTLLVIVDMQNFFVHPLFRDHASGLATVPALRRVIAKCRAQNIQLCWLNWGISDHDLKVMPPAVTRGFCRSLASTSGNGWHVGLGKPLPQDQGGERCLFQGTWNADIYDAVKDVVTPDDVRFDKARMSGLWSPELPFHKWLVASGKKTLLFAGVNTDQCLLGTLTDAYSWGWDCILLGDCAATMTGLGAQAVCDYNIATNMGFVTDSETFCRAQETTTSASPSRMGSRTASPSPHDSARASEDGVEIHDSGRASCDGDEKADLGDRFEGLTFEDEGIVA